jgi:hypothetical protein
MKPLYISVLLFFINAKCEAQNSLWQEIKFNNVLSFSLPAQYQSKHTGYLQAVAGELNSNYYGFQYADTIMAIIDDSDQFRISLLGFISARASDPVLKGYSAIVADTSIGGSSGLVGKFTTADSSQYYKLVYYYATIANGRYCWFFAYSPSNKDNTNEINYFFNSIKFDSKKLKESAFKLSPVSLKKDRL